MSASHGLVVNVDSNDITVTMKAEEHGGEKVTVPQAGDLLVRTVAGQQGGNAMGAKNSNKMNMKAAKTKNKSMTRPVKAGNGNHKGKKAPGVSKKRKAMPHLGSRAREAKRKEQVIRNREMSKTSRTRKDMRFKLLETEMSELQHKLEIIVAMRNSYDGKSIASVHNALLEHHEFWNRLDSVDNRASRGVVVEETRKQQLLKGLIPASDPEGNGPRSSHISAEGYQKSAGSESMPDLSYLQTDGGSGAGARKGENADVAPRNSLTRQAVSIIDGRELTFFPSRILENRDGSRKRPFVSPIVLSNQRMQRAQWHNDFLQFSNLQHAQEARQRLLKSIDDVLTDMMDQDAVPIALLCSYEPGRGGKNVLEPVKQKELTGKLSELFKELNLSQEQKARLKGLTLGSQKECVNLKASEVMCKQLRNLLDEVHSVVSTIQSKMMGHFPKSKREKFFRVTQANITSMAGLPIEPNKKGVLRGGGLLGKVVEASSGPRGFAFF
jgi:hypothetical protein